MKNKLLKLRNFKTLGIVDISLADIKKIKRIIQSDSYFLEKQNIMDYSLYVVIEIF